MRRGCGKQRRSDHVGAAAYNEHSPAVALVTVDTALERRKINVGTDLNILFDSHAHDAYSYISAHTPSRAEQQTDFITRKR